MSGGTETRSSRFGHRQKSGVVEGQNSGADTVPVPDPTGQRIQLVYRSSPPASSSRVVALRSGSLVPGQQQLSPSLFPSSPSGSSGRSSSPPFLNLPPVSPASSRRLRSPSVEAMEQGSAGGNSSSGNKGGVAGGIPKSPPGMPRKLLINDALARAQSREAQKTNDAMVYLDGPQVYGCAQCRTHLTSHDDIISKSFHGRHGRAYLFDQCVNVTIGPAEDRQLITGLHSVCDIYCKRCKKMVGWTYQKAYEASQKYKEGKYIIEKINLFREENDHYDVPPPAGEKTDRFRKRSMSWGSEASWTPTSPGGGLKPSIVYEYRPSP